MSSDLSTKDISSEDLDLNSNAASLEEQDESFRVCGSEFSGTVSVYVDATLAEEGGHDEVRVSDGDCPVETLKPDCDVRMEGKLDEEAAQVDAVASGEGCGLEGEEKVTANEVVLADATEMIANSGDQTVNVVVEVEQTVNEVVEADATESILNSTEEAEAVVKGEVMLMGDEVPFTTNNEVSGIGTMDEKLSSCREKGQRMEAEAIGGCAESFQHDDLSCEGNGSIPDERLERVAEVDEPVCNPACGDEKIDSQPVEEITNEGPRVTNDSNTDPEASNESEAAGACTSLQNVGELGIAEVTESVGSLMTRELDSEVQVTECLVLTDKEQKSGMEVVKVESMLAITKSEVEHIQVFVGGEVAIVESDKESETSKEVSQIGVLDTDMYCPEKNQRYESEVPGSGIDSLPNGDPFGKNNPCVQDIKEEKATLEPGMAFNKVDGDENMDSHIVEENLHGEAGYLMVNPKLMVAKTDEVFGGEVALTDGVEVSEMKYGTSEVNTLAGNPSSAEDIHRMESEALSGSIESYSEESTRNEENTSMQSAKQCITTEVAETVSIWVDEDKSMDSHPVEGNRHEEACVILDETPLSKDSDGSQSTGLCSSLHLGCEVDPPQDTVSVGHLEDGNSTAEVQIAICHTSLEMEQKVGMEVINIDGSTVTTKSLVNGVEVVNMNNEEASELGDEISEFNDLNGTPCLLGQNHILEDEVQNEDVKQDIANEGVSTATNLVHGQGTKNSLFVKDNVSKGVRLAIDSDSHAKFTDTWQASVSASLHGEGEPKSTQVISACYSEKDISNSEVQVVEGLGLEDEEQKAANELVRVEIEMETTELLVEQTQLVEEQVAATGEASVIKDEVSGTDNSVCNCPSLEKNQIMEDAAVGSSEPVSNGDLSYQGNMPKKDEEQEGVNLVTETVPYQVDGGVGMDLYPVEENLNEEACDVHGVNEAGSACATDIVEPLADVHVDSEVQVIEGHTSPTQKDQIIRTDGSQNDTSLGEIEDEVEAAGGSLKLEEKQIADSHLSATGISQVSGSEQIIAGLVEDLESIPVSDGNFNAEDDVIKEDVSHQDGSHGKEMDVEMGFSELNHLDENVVDGAGHVCSDENENLGTADHATGFQRLKLKSVETHSIQGAILKPDSDSDCEYTANYHLASEKEGEFSVSDLVWGKVKCHPWWPGQIFDLSESSEQALRYQKKDSVLVAYFGDQTFAWNDSFSLKPFQTHFPQMEKQSGSETFRSAVDCALNEVQRRVELGMACSCTPEEAYNKVKAQAIENAGIREEARIRDGVDKSLSAYSFEPDKLVLYIKALGLDPCGACDRLELVIAQAQLKAFYFLKGFGLPEFHVYGGFSENLDSPLLGGRYSQEVVDHTIPDFKTEEQHIGRAKPKSQGSSSRKRKHVWEDGLYPIRKEKGLSELMAGDDVSSTPAGCGKSAVDEKADIKSAHSSSMKRKAVETFFDDSAMKSRKEMLSPTRDADTESPAPQSFKVGECIRRIASKLTGAPSILKCSGERFQKSALKVVRDNEKHEFVGGSPYTPEEFQKRRFVISKECSPEEMLSQLCLAAHDPIKGYSFLDAIIGFFTDFRNSICLDVSSSWMHKRSDKMDGIKTCTGMRAPTDAEIRSAKTFDFEDMSDSYWTDRVIQSSPEEQPCMDRKRKGKSQGDPSLEAIEPDSALLLTSTVDANEQDHDGHHDLINEKPTRKYRRRRKPQLEFPMNMDIPFDSKQQNYADDHDVVQVSNLNETPTALILSFTDVNSVPSEMNLNKTFSRFGPLKLSETEVRRDTGSARVVFKKRTDAEVACSSAGKFSIFGPTLVTYQLMYLSSTPRLKASFHANSDGRKDSSMEGN